MIIVTSPSKSFTYTAKSTPRRPAIINDYAPEIEALYAAADETTQAHLSPPASWTVANSREFVRSVVHHVIVRAIGDQDDLFQNGCDRYAFA